MVGDVLMCLICMTTTFFCVRILRTFYFILYIDELSRFRLSHPDYDLFTNYKEYMMRNPVADVHLLDPRSVWSLWEALQDFSGDKIRRNPPTSGFIGIALLLPICEYISVVEYMPSTRLTSSCHYYDDEMNSGCTFGTWHPLAAEKLMVLDMNSADDFTVFQTGYLRINKISARTCRI